MTGKELAKKLNLSAAAVSLVLNGKPGVSDKTRKLVMTAAEEYGFNFSKLNNKHSGMGVIDFILYRRQGAIVTETPFFSQLTEGIEAACKNLGYQLQINYLYKSDDVEEQLTKLAYSKCAGIILLGTEMTIDDYTPFRETRIPLVLLDVYFDSTQHDCVIINNVQGAFIATDYLITQTMAEPGYLHSAYSIPNFEERADGFYKAVRHNCMSTSKSIVHRLTPTVDGAYADMLELLDANEEIAECYFADNDYIALGAMKAMQDRGIKIPDDVSIIGFDNIPATTLVSPQLSTVNVPKQYMGEIAIRSLVSNINERNPSIVKIEVATKLVKRFSIAARQPAKSPKFR